MATLVAKASRQRGDFAFTAIAVQWQANQQQPDRQTLESELATAGFGQIERSRLIPGDAFWGLVARP